ncbi:hypothetical protein CFI00_00650 [Nocardioides sp. S5]|uniref:DUF6153 family protein n=1 Tax=Nocardioides sp. S5 TaxID=2017486 RepID=UPI001A8E08F2|nr:DUF6153 family protein [Nocardioides sp. S5]QSR29037.1 hypothetical protein CFI00_00650 [Nocardioides sp. S5]
MSRPSPAPHRAALATLVAALVVGILGMHALTLDGPSPEAYAVAPATAHGDHGAGHGNAHEPATSAPVTSAPDHGSGQHADHLLMLCAAMLAVAALLLLAGLLVRAVRPVRLVRAFAPLAPTSTVRSWVRATGPPPAWQFSVIRC